jgi:hypothetical protein
VVTHSLGNSFAPPFCFVDRLHHLDATIIITIIVSVFLSLKAALLLLLWLLWTGFAFKAEK